MLQGNLCTEHWEYGRIPPWEFALSQCLLPPGLSHSWVLPWDGAAQHTQTQKGVPLLLSFPLLVPTFQL